MNVSSVISDSLASVTTFLRALAARINTPSRPQATAASGGNVGCRDVMPFRFAPAPLAAENEEWRDVTPRASNEEWRDVTPRASVPGPMLGVRSMVLTTMLTVLCGLGSAVASDLIISQYTETESGSTPKGIEILNVSGSAITFNSTTKKLIVKQGTNGGALTEIAATAVTSGTLPAGGVWVIGTADIGTYLTGQGIGVSQYTSYTFIYNGDDALQITLGGVVQDTFGNPGNDPGTKWSGSGAETADDNIAIKSGIVAGDLDGWTDPSTRFDWVSVGSTLTGFGVAPVAATPTVAIDNTGTPTAGNVTAGASDVVLFGFRLTPSASVDFTGLTLTKAGTTTSSDLSNFQVVYDADNSGTYNGGDSIVSDTKAIGGTIAFVMSGQTGIAAARRYLVIADVASGATASRTFTGSIAAAGDVTTTGTESGTAAGNTMTVQAAAYSAASDIIRDTSFTEPSNIAYGSYQEANLTSASLQVGQFTIRDGGGAADADSVGTTLDAITFTVANGANLRRVALYDGSTEVAEVAGGGTVTFPGPLGLLAADGGTKTFKVLASFNSSVTDNQQLTFTVSSATANSGGSTFTTISAATSTTTDRNRIEVAATKLVFSTEPSSCTINQDFTAAVQAQDANNNLDLDSTVSVAISKATGSGTLSAVGGLTRSLSSGAQTWADLRIDTAGTITIHANDGGALTDVTSVNISASAGPTTLAAGDIAVIGYNTSGAPDNFAILVLKDLGPGTVFYVNDNEISADGGTTFADVGEAEASFTVKSGQTIPAGTVIILPWQSAAVSTSTYDWNNNNGSPGLGNANEEVYLYTAAAIGDATPTAFIFGTRIGSSTSSRPSGLTAGTTWITTTGSASRYKTSGATYTGTQSTLLTAIGNTAANWEATAPGSAGDWTFNVVTLAAEPTTHASAVNFTSVGANGMTVNWTSGNGANCIVVAKAGSAPTGTPTDGVAVTANAAYGTGGTALGDGFVVYDGGTDSVTLSGLSVGTTYYVKIFEYNGSGATANYYTGGTPGNGSQVTDSAPTLDATPTSASVEDTTVTLGGNVSATGGDNVTERGIYWSTSNGFTPPGQGTKDSETGSFGTGAFTRNVSGLPAGQTVYFKSFALNGAGTTYSANQGSILMKPAAPTAQEETGASSSGFNANWSASTGASGYRLDVSTVNTFASYVTGYQDLNVNNVTTYAVGGLNPSSTYYYRVRAVNATGTSGNSGTITADTTATLTVPSLTTPAATGIGDTTATLGATITADGNDTITSRGTVWGTSANPTGNGAAAGGTALGAFSHARSGLPVGTLIYYRGYAVNGQGTGYSEDGTFYTLSTEPTAHAGSFAAAAASGTSIDLSWTAAAGASGYLILQRTGGDPTGTPADGTGYTVGNTIGDGTVAAIVTPGGATATTIGSLTANTVYHFAIIPFAWDGSHDATLNYRTAATVPTASDGTLAALSDVVENNGTTDNIAYASYQEAADLATGNSVSVFGVRVRDGGAGSDNDTAGTELTAISFTVSDAATLRRAALYDGVTELAEIAVSGSPLVFSGVSATATDGGTKDLTLRVSFTTAVADNQELDFAVSAVTAAAAGSGFAAANGGAAASDTALDANKIEVTATKLVFLAPVPTTCTVNENFSATVQARDANEKVDLDRTTSVTVSKASGSGALSGGGATALVAGEKVFSTLQINAAGAFTLTASDGTLTDATSDPITASSLGLQAGDIAIIAMNADNNDSFAFVAVRDIPANTTITFTDNPWTGAALGSGSEGYVQWSHNAVVKAGTVVTISASDSNWAAANASIGAATESMSTGFSNDGDQCLAFLGTWAERPTTADSSRWLAAFSLENFSYDSGNASRTSDLPGALATYGAAMTTSASETDNAYFANGTASAGSVTVSGTKADLVTLFTNGSGMYYQNNTGPLTFPTYTITVLADAPTTAPANPTFANVDDDSMDVSWASNGDGERVIVVARQGAAPSADPTDATTYTASASYTGGGTAVGGGKVVYLGSGSSVTVTDLTAGQSYYFRVYALNGTDGTGASGLRENVKTDAYGAASQGTTGGHSLESDMARASGFTEPENVAYASYQATDITGAGDSIELARFTIRDGGADLTDSDSLGTSLTAIEFTVANGASLRRVALYDGATEIAEVAGGATVSFSGLTGLTASDGSDKDFSVRATFLASVTDNAQLQFTINSVSADVAGSSFTTVSAASDTTGDRNRIEVTATKLAFSAYDTAVGVAAAFSATVQARDANNNVDLDSTASVTITKATGSGTLTGGTAQNLVAGACTFAALEVDAADTYTLTAASAGLTDATSGDITASVGPLWAEDFETDGAGTRYTRNEPDFSDAGNDYCGRIPDVGVAANLVITGASGSHWFGGQDHDGDGKADEQTLTWSGINISGYVSLEFKGLFAEDDADDALEDWDDGEYVHVLYRIDGGAWQNLIWFEAAAASNAEPREDTNFDGTGEGTALTSLFTEFTKSIAGTGSTLDLQVLASVEAGDEDWNIDNFRITGTSSTPATEPTTQATDVQFASIGAAQMDVSWTAGNGAGRLVICREGSAPSGAPVDTTTYTADADFSGSGSALGDGKVVYSGTGNSFTLTGLTPATTYHLRIFEYNGVGGGINYLTATASGNPGSQATSEATSYVTPGNLLVYMVDGNGSALGSDAALVKVREYTPAGALANTFTMPSGAAAGTRLTGSGSATSEGKLTVSPDGTYAALIGYDAQEDTIDVKTTLNRTIGRISIQSGAVDLTTTGLLGGHDGARGVAVDNTGTKFWAAMAPAGTDTGDKGMWYKGLGAGTGTQLANVNSRGARIFDGQLYEWGDSTGNNGIYAVGTGLPESGSPNLTGLPGLSGNSGLNGYGFFMADLDAAEDGLDTLWMARDSDGVSKYSKVSGTWTLNNTIDPGQVFHIDVAMNGSVATIYIVEDGDDGDTRVMTLTDSTGYNANMSGSFTELIADDANTAFRCVAVVPKPAVTVQAPATTLEFGDVLHRTVSLVPSYTVAARALNGDLIITAPTGFQISTASGSGFASSLTLTGTDGVLAATTIYVRINTQVINAYSGNITHVNSYTGTETKPVSGNVVKNDGTVFRFF